MDDPLLIDVEALTRARGLQMEGTVTAPIPPITVPSGEIAATEPIHLRYRLTHTGDGRIWLEARLRAQATLICDRCLERYDVQLSADYEEEYRPRMQEEELEGDGAGETRVAFYDGACIDLREGVRQNLLLAVPAKQLCRDDCRGLCPRCGRNLNEGSCQCAPEEEGDPRLAALDQWLERHRNEEEL